MNRYGGILLEKAPKETTQFLKKLCTDYKPLVEQVTKILIQNYCKFEFIIIFGFQIVIVNLNIFIT